MKMKKKRKTSERNLARQQGGLKSLITREICVHCVLAVVRDFSRLRKYFESICVSICAHWLFRFFNSAKSWIWQLAIQHDKKHNARNNFSGNIFCSCKRLLLLFFSFNYFCFCIIEIIYDMQKVICTAKMLMYPILFENFVFFWLLEKKMHFCDWIDVGNQLHKGKRKKNKKKWKKSQKRTGWFLFTLQRILKLIRRRWT